MIDLHCHVLPGIDDGPRDLAGSLALAHTARDGGTRVLAATSHVSWEWPNAAASLAAGREVVNRHLREHGVGIEVVRGAEIAVPYLLELGDDELDELRLGDGDTLLVECPLGATAAPLDAVAYNLRRRGYRVLLAHPERSPSLRREPGRLESLVGAGALTSITAGSLLGQFGRDVKRFSYWMLEQGLVHNVASDAHGATWRPPDLREALRAAAALEAPRLADHIDWLAHDVPRAIIDGAPLPARPPGGAVVAGGTLRRLAGRLRGGG